MKAPAHNDPMALIGVSLPAGDEETMTRCLIEEYLLMGWSERQILLLFTRPCFHVTYGIYRAKGEAWVRARIDEIRREWTTSASDREAAHAEGP